jgi:acetoin:2,6-dichlorophenolindophenol oxidoreductase subunit beta
MQKVMFFLTKGKCLLMSINKKKMKNYADAIFDATFLKMKEDKSVFVYGLGVDDAKGMYGTTLDLHKEFGNIRNFDTPLSEDAMTGVGIGAALAGQRPIHVHQRMDFLLLCMNQLINIASKTSYMFNGAFKVPLVIRSIIGRSWGQGAQHSQSFHSYFMHTPGVRVVAPTTPHDAKGCMIASIEDNNPVIFLEHRMLYKNEGLVPSNKYSNEIGKGRVLVSGADITIIAVSHMVVEALRAAELLKEVGVHAEVIDPIWLAPLDQELIFESVNKTRNILVVDHSWVTAGFASEIIALIAENDNKVQGKVKFTRMGYENVPCPTTKPLEEIFYPNALKIAKKAYERIGNDPKTWNPNYSESKEINEFKGPF